MWFRNLTLYRFTEPFPMDPAPLAEALERMPFRPVGDRELQSWGWVAPLGRNASELIHSVQGRLLLCLQSQERVLPAAVVKEVADERAAEIEAEEGRTLKRRERSELRQRVFEELLPQAFTRTRRTWAYLDPAGWLIVDGAGRKPVEAFTAALRKALGSLPIRPLQTVRDPAAAMTGWLAGDPLPDSFELEDSCELKDAEEGSVVRCKGQDLLGEEIKSHLVAGKRATRLGLIWQQRVALVLGDDLVLRRLRFLDRVQEQLDELELETPEQAMDAEFALMGGELAELLPAVVAALGEEEGLAKNPP
ncbi:MAG: recombination-associated protein RdgC [Candidatus Competibacteraceae bacterium]|nr:recombination-associated protein RdgC [Candidatus Competibacteraceae bacterium]